MTTKKLGRQTVALANPPTLAGHANVVGKKEGEGPLASSFDLISSDDTFGEATWEKSESAMQKQALALALDKAGQAASAMDWLFAGDLLNQCIGATFGLREMGIPFVGIYGACSNMAEGLALSALMVDGGAMKKTIAVTSSHFCTAERQYRFPLEYGGQRPLTAQWTVTGSGAAIVGERVSPPYIKAVTLGCIEDLGIKDANNMGAAMAPAAAATIKRFFEDTCTVPDNYDLILTGDLGQVGSDLLHQLLEREGYHLGKKQADCGLLIYDRETQDVHAGGSGCGCSASVLCSYILPAVKDGRIKNMLFVATGALLSPTSVQQGESIPGIAHLIHLSADDDTKTRPSTAGGM